MQFISPAKINIFLRVLSKRADGYHELASLFQAVDLSDRIEFQLSNEDVLTSTDTSIPSDRRNLIWKAVDIFKRKTGLQFHLKINLEKNIPAEAGLGGGSSNAATTLWALNEMHGTNLNPQTLSEWGAEIGSDIAFFFSMGRAYCTGRGEQVQSLPNIEKSPFLWLVKPKFSLSTVQVYNMLNLEECAKEDPEILLRESLAGKTILLNDLERAAFKRCPELLDLKKSLLSQHFETVSMTGSGTALICFGEKSPKVASDIYVKPLKFCYREENRWYTEKRL